MDALDLCHVNKANEEANTLPAVKVVRLGRIRMSVHCATSERHPTKAAW